MTRLRRVLLQIEVGICFAPLALQLSLGALIAPMQVYFLLTAEPRAKLGALVAIALIAAGLCGLVALGSVMSWLLYRKRTTLKPRTVVLLMCIGLLVLLGLALVVNTWIGIVAVIPAVLCSIHLIWLARGYLFGTDPLPASN